MGFTDKTLDENFKGHNLLIDVILYGKKGLPTELEEKLFQYSIDSVVLSLKEKSHQQFWCKYEDVVIDEGVDT